MEENKKSKKGLSVAIIVGIIVLVLVAIGDIVVNYVPLKEIFSKNVKYVTEKEVTVTDKGISDAVSKLYNASVIVEVGTSEDKLSGWGSGFVYKTDGKYGYIFTNHHVVDGAKSIKIVLSDETEVAGELVGSDEYADVAVVKIPKDKVIAVAEIGKSEDVLVGDTIFAIGTPVSLEYSFTVTRGILSGKNRMVEMSSSSKKSYYGQSGDSWYMNLLQIDASINSGNSGGPLANSNGEVIGITNSKLSSSTLSGTSIENMGFAIPIEDALSVAEYLENNGKVTRPVLGVTMTSVEGAEYNGVSISDSIKSGAVITDVSTGSTAADAKLKKGDVIVKLDDYNIKDYKYLKYYLYRYRVGDKVKITYIRDGKQKEVEVTLKD